MTPPRSLASQNASLDWKERVLRRSAEINGDPAMQAALLELAERCAMRRDGLKADQLAALLDQCMGPLTMAADLLHQAMRILEANGCSLPAAILSQAIDAVESEISGDADAL